jgi:hypothetical protein
MLLTRRSDLTGNVSSREIDVTEEELALWRNGVLIQVAMPSLSNDDREFIKTGITPEEWDTLLGPAD